jgi:hypothetical protein
MWDTLKTEYGGSDADTELYIIVQYHDYHMVDEKSVVTQAHEIQCMVKELALLKIVIPDEFVVGCIIVKLPLSWRDFSTTLKHKRVQLKNMQHAPSINKNAVSGSLLCRDGFKVVLELNKFVMLKCGQFIGKGYVCRDLFHFLSLISVISS